MKVECRLILAVSCMGILVKADWRPSTFLENPLDDPAETVKVIQNRIHENFAHGTKTTRKYADEPTAYRPSVPFEFAREISDFRIPGERDIPKTLSSDEIESEEEESEESDDNSRDEENQEEEEDLRDEDEAEEADREEEGDDVREHEQELEDDREPHGDGSGERDNGGHRGHEYDDYEEVPPNIVYESKKEIKKPLKKKVVNYEVTEKIPDDTKPQRPKGPVYPFPPPCPGAPPPTFPPPPPPSTKPPVAPKPIKGFYIPPTDLNQIPFFDSYFPTSYMSQSHSTPPEVIYAPGVPITPRLKAKKKSRYPRRASPQRVIIRYHHPPAYVVRKVHHHPYSHAADPVIVRPLSSHRPKEVHIHHHHTRPVKAEQVIHVHKNDEDDALEEARFTADLEGQKLFSEAELDAATSGPFAEPPLNFKRKSPNTSVEHIHTS